MNIKQSPWFNQNPRLKRFNEIKISASYVEFISGGFSTEVTSNDQGWLAEFEGENFLSGSELRSFRNSSQPLRHRRL